MAEVIRMPKMSDTMTEGVIASWLKKVGDTVKTGDVLAEVETDKATMELESYNEGTILYITDQKNVPIDDVIAVVGKPGEDFNALLSGKSGGSAEPKAETKPVEEAKPATTPAPTPTPAANVKATLVLMPQMTDTMTEGVIVKWHKQVGDAIKNGDLLAEIETDKATMDFESPETGTLLYLGAKEGEAIQAKTPLAIIGEKGADYQALLTGGSGSGSTSTPATQPATTPETPKQTTSTPATVSDSDERVKISPLAKKIAADKGVDIQQLKGSGENGRIVKRDIETFTPSSQPATTTPTSQPAAEK